MRNRLFFAEARAEKDGFRDRCAVWAATPELAAKAAGEILDARVEYLFEMPTDPGHEIAVHLFAMVQFTVAKFGSEYHVR
jgi:hypothetical protein